MEGVGHFEVIVEADDVEGVGDSLLVIAIDGGGDDAGGIELVAAADHGGGDFRALFGHGALQRNSSLPMDQMMMEGELR